MMKTVIVFLMLLLATSVPAQEEKMRIHLEDGTELVIPISDIQSLKFTELQLPEYRAMRFSPHRMTDVEYDHVYADHIDSMYFRLNNDQKTELRFATKGGVSQWGHYGPTTIADGWSRIDELSFWKYWRNTKMHIAEGYTEYYPPALDWHGRTLFLSTPARNINLDVEYKYVSSEQLADLQTNFISVSKDGKKALLINTSNRFSVRGRLCELDIASGVVTTVLGDTNTTKAQYVGGSNDVIYFTLNGSAPGTYLLDRSTDVSELIEAYSESGGGGFYDVSRGGDKVLLRKLDSASQIPLLIQHRIGTGDRDTVDIPFSTPVRSAQYDSTGARLLYTAWNNPGVLQAGIMTLTGLIETSLDLLPDTELSWATGTPKWSEDETVVAVPIAWDYNPFGPFYYVYILRVSD